MNSTSGTAGGYQLGAGTTLPPLLLDDEEAVAVAVGLRTAASGSVAGTEEPPLRALSKLQQVLLSRLRRRVAALHSFIEPLANLGPTGNAEVFTAIASACRDHETLRFSYRSREGAATTRGVEPHRMVHTGRRWYLVAGDLAKNDWRTFRVDRIQPGLKTVLRFAPPGGDFAAYVSRSVSYAPYPHRAHILLHTCVLSTGASSLDHLSVFVALIGFEFEVRNPLELMERIRFLAERFTRATAR